MDAIPKVMVRRFGAHEIALQRQEVESAIISGVNPFCRFMHIFDDDVYELPLY